jgi:multidrug efflux pump subunit AcrB
MIRARARPGTRLETTEKIITEIEATVQEVVGRADPQEEDSSSDLKLLISNIGVLYDWPAAYTPNEGPMDSFLLVQLKQDRQRTAQEWAQQLRGRLTSEFPEVEFSFDTGGMLTAALNMGLPSPIDIQIQGSKLEVLHEIAQTVVAEVKQIEGTQDVRVAQTLDYPAIRVDVDRERAAQLGISQEEAIKNVVTALNSSVSFNPAFWIDPRNGNHYFIGAQYAEENIQSFNTLENIPITGKDTARPVLLKNIARLTRTTSPSTVRHLNITRTVDVYANVEGRDLGSVAQEIEERLALAPGMVALMDQPHADGSQGYASRGYRLNVRGEYQTMVESFGQFRMGLAVAAVLVFLVMVAQLRSFLLPLVIFLTVPLGLIGVVAVLWITGTPLSIPSFMGIILMVGLVVEYSILMVDFAVRRQREGVAPQEAILEAARTRLRPLLMTSLTTALALLPMALGIGRGSEANVPLARAIIGAVVGGAVLSLLVVPALYSVFGGRVKVASEESTAELSESTV